MSFALAAVICIRGMDQIFCGPYGVAAEAA